MGKICLTPVIVQKKGKKKNVPLAPPTVSSQRNRFIFLVVELNSILSSPFPSRSLVSRPIGLVHMGNLGHKRVVGIRICEHGANGKKDFRNGKSRTPLVSQDV